MRFKFRGRWVLAAIRPRMACATKNPSKVIAWCALFGCLFIAFVIEIDEAARYNGHYEAGARHDETNKKTEQVISPETADDRIARYTEALAICSRVDWSLFRQSRFFFSFAPIRSQGSAPTLPRATPRL